MPSRCRGLASLLPEPLFPHLTAVPGKTAWLGTVWGHPSRSATTMVHPIAARLFSKTKPIPSAIVRGGVQKITWTFLARPRPLLCPARGGSIAEACSWLPPALVLTMACSHPLP